MYAHISIDCFATEPTAGGDGGQRRRTAAADGSGALQAAGSGGGGGPRRRTADTGMEWTEATAMLRTIRK